MSMTQIAFLKEVNIPAGLKIQEKINSLGYDFKFIDDFDSLKSADGVSCKINGHETFIEIYQDSIEEVTEDEDWIKDDLTDQDTAISFVWGADFAAGASIALISIALIDLSNALIYYMDDEMKYSREMLVNDLPQYFNELNKSTKPGWLAGLFKKK